jgi:L-arabinose isomerase
VDSRCLRLARCQGLKLARFGDNMRSVAVTEGDKVEAQMRLGYVVHGYGVGDLAQLVAAVSDAEIDRLVNDYEAQYSWRRICAPAVSGTSPCAKRPASSLACAAS